MPRVHTKVKSTRGKTYKCQSCREDILPGESYYEWSRRFGRSGQTYRQHEKCGRPKPTQLSSRKTAVLEEAINDADFSSFSPEIDLEALDTQGGEIEVDISDLETILEEIADVAREIGQEYQDGYDNMPEGLNQGSTAQAMEEVAQELESWADDLVSSADLETTFVYEAFSYDAEDERSEDEQEEDWRNDVESEWDAFVQNVSEAASGAIQDYPEYQG
jgi:hypothetical protein